MESTWCAQVFVIPFFYFYTRVSFWGTAPHQTKTLKTRNSVHTISLTISKLTYHLDSCISPILPIFSQKLFENDKLKFKPFLEENPIRRFWKVTGEYIFLIFTTPTLGRNLIILYLTTKFDYENIINKDVRT